LYKVLYYCYVRLTKRAEFARNVIIKNNITIKLHVVLATWYVCKHNYKSRASDAESPRNNNNYMRRYADEKFPETQLVVTQFIKLLHTRHTTYYGIISTVARNPKKIYVLISFFIFKYLYDYSGPTSSVSRYVGDKRGAISNNVTSQTWNVNENWIS